MTNLKFIRSGPFPDSYFAVIEGSGLHLWIEKEDTGFALTVWNDRLPQYDKEYETALGDYVSLAEAKKAGRAYAGEWCNPNVIAKNGDWS
jgi:hypothetical protein